jgi:hypothetical protein
MTSVQSRLLRLSGNKYWPVLFIGLSLSACSPKVTSTATKKIEPEKAQEKPVEKPVARFSQANIALLVPFHLSGINLKTATKAEVEKSAMAIDFYQGLKIGLDSAAAMGLNFKLNVYDTRNNNSRIAGLVQNGGLNASNLIIGPVFPEGLKYIKEYSMAQNIPVVNPLAATHPAEFNNPNLISIANNIDLHAKKLGDFIEKTYDPARTVIVLINPRTPDDEVMAAPLRTYFANGKKPFVFQEYSSVFLMETKLIRNKKYVIIISSSDRTFVIPTLDKLVKLKNAGLLAPDVFGHPDWVKQNYNTDKLQALRVAVTSSYKIDYTSIAVNDFIKKYRSAFHFEPGEYAFKGFDIGFYFATLISEHGPKYLPYLTREKYKGLHNRFSFVHDEKLGYINTSLMLLRYENFALTIIE